MQHLGIQLNVMGCIVLYWIGLDGAGRSLSTDADSDIGMKSPLHASRPTPSAQNKMLFEAVVSIFIFVAVLFCVFALLIYFVVVVMVVVVVVVVVVYSEGLECCNQPRSKVLRRWLAEWHLGSHVGPQAGSYWNPSHVCAD